MVIYENFDLILWWIFKFFFGNDRLIVAFNIGKRSYKKEKYYYMISSSHHNFLFVTTMDNISNILSESYINSWVVAKERYR
jgi:hypothetical protein